MALAHGKTQDASSIINSASQIRRQSKATFLECEKQLLELKAGANHWLDVSAFLKGDSQVLPIKIPEYVARAANLVKSAATSGSIPATTLLTLVDEINRNSMHALSYLKETEKRLARIKSASGVAIAVQSESFFDRIKSHDGFTASDQARLKRYLPFVAKVASERRLKHAASHFEPHSFKRVYKNLELTATGVEL
jgi:hypothetical protein